MSRPRLYHASPWTAADAGLAFCLALASYLLIAIVAGAGLAAIVAAEVLGLALVPLAVVRLRGLPPATLGLVRPSPRALLAATLVGACTWYVALRVTAPWAALLEDDGASRRGLETIVEATPLAALILLSLVPAVCEEIAARGLLTLGLRRRLGAAGALLISTVAFAALHLSLVRAVPTAILGLVLGVLALRAGSIVPSMLAHALNNAIALAIATGHLDPVWRAIEAAPDLALVVAAAGVLLGVAIPLRNESNNFTASGDR